MGVNWKHPAIKYFSLVLLAIATVFLFFINLSGVSSKGFLTTLWFSEFPDTQSVDGFYYKRWTLYRLCGATFDRSIQMCSKRETPFPFNPGNVILAFSYMTTKSRADRYVNMTKAAYGLLLVLLIFTLATLLLKLATLKITKLVLVGNILHMLAVVFCTSAFALITAVHLDAVNFYTGGKLGTAAFGFMWSSFGCNLVSLILGFM